MRDAHKLMLPDELEEIRSYIDDMQAAIELTIPDRASDDRTLIDYGCGTGRWIAVAQNKFAHVVGLDINSSFVSRARRFAEMNDLQNVSFVDRSIEPVEAIPRADAMICIDAITLMRCDHAHEMFSIARSRLPSGGRFLLCARRVASMADQVLTLERFKYDGIVNGLRRYAALSRSALEAALFPRIRDIPRGRIYYHRDAIPMLADEYGFSLEKVPEDLAATRAISRLEWLFKGQGTETRRFRWFNWYLLRKN